INVVVEINCNGIDGDNSAWTAGVDRRRLLPHTQAFWSEAPNQPEYLPDGRLISFIRTYKMARAYRNTALNYISESEASMGECLAFNQTIGSAGQYPLNPEMVKYISFYRRKRDFYAGTKDVATIAVFRSYPSLTYHNSRAQLSAILAEQALIQARIPFHLILGENLGELSPSHCKALVLPDTECLSDEQLAFIREFVEAGGGLIATGRTGLYDTWRRLRIKRGFERLLENQAHGSAYEEEVASVKIPPAPPQRNQIGRGRAVYIAALEYDGSLPP